MRLRNKTLYSIVAIWLIFLIATFTLLFPFLTLFQVGILLAWGIICVTGIFHIEKILVFNRLDKLIAKLKSHQTPTLIQNIGNDEIATLIFQINNITTHYLSTEEKLTLQQEEPKTPFYFVEKDLNVHKGKLSQLAHYDSLTALPNRMFFNEMLNKSLNHAIRHHKTVAVLFIDIDRFKDINDALGKVKGDEILKEIAHRFTTVLRSGDIIARLGGDEFIILLNDISHPKFAGTIAEKILQICTAPLVANGRNFYVTASIGISIFPEDAASLEDLQKNADLALYKAKVSGGGVYQYYINKMTLEAHQHYQLDQALRKAVSNNEFVLYYQPKLSITNNSIKGVEALIRWENPDVGLINPNNFIPQAEESGLIMQIGEWVLREACRAAKTWQNQGYKPISVAVNLSPVQFNHPDIVSVIEKVLIETGINPKFLELEITESTIMENIEETIKKLTAIKKLGVKICIDDFGTGYTSINFLKKFPIDVLKIDQSFIKGIPDNSNDLAITGAIISLGHNLGIEVIAEGVETQEQLRFLTEHNCELVQGYYFSRPLPEVKMILQLEKNA